MFSQRTAISYFFVFIFYPKFISSQSAQILSQNARIQRLCSEMSTTCARSCQSYIGHCNLNVISPPSIGDMPQTIASPAPTQPNPDVVSTAEPVVPGNPAETTQSRCWDHRQNFLERLCSDMSNTCARNCQTFIEQCNVPSGPGISQDGQINQPVADAPQQPQPTLIVPIINAPPASSSTSQQICKSYKDPCVDHRDCCDFLYCRRFMHSTGAEAKLGYCEHDPALIRYTKSVNYK